MFWENESKMTSMTNLLNDLKTTETVFNEKYLTRTYEKNIEK